MRALATVSIQCSVINTGQWPPYPFLLPEDCPVCLVQVVGMHPWEKPVQQDPELPSPVVQENSILAYFPTRRELSGRLSDTVISIHVCVPLVMKVGTRPTFSIVRLWEIM